MTDKIDEILAALLRIEKLLSSQPKPLVIKNTVSTAELAREMRKAIIAGARYA